MPLIWGLGILAIAGFTGESVNKLQDWGWVPEFGKEDVQKIFEMPEVAIEGDNPWWNLRWKDYDSALVGLAVLGLLVWGTKS